MPIRWNAPHEPIVLEDSVRELSLSPIGHYADHSPVYSFGRSFPWLTTTDDVRPTKAAAWADGQAWLNRYTAEAQYARMGVVLGVTRRDDGFVAVVNYFHSNT